MQPVSSGQRQVLTVSHRQAEPVFSALDVQKAKLRNTTRDFEAIFIRQLLNGMNATLMDGGMFGEGMAGAIYSDLMISAIADKIAERGGIGLGDILYRRMVKFIDPEEQSGTAVQQNPMVKGLPEK
ncbi:rod-binding protein [Candidatus Latescibacterota bacterium]